MGDSTRARMAGLVKAANAGGGGDRASGNYVGGYGGGLGGTWGKAATNRGIDPRGGAGGGGGGIGGAGAPGPAAGAGGDFGGAGASARPPSAGRQRPSSAVGQRDKIRSGSSGVKSAWDMPQRELPKAPPFGTAAKLVKPPGATMAGGKSTKPLTGIGMDFKAPGRGAMEAVGGAVGTQRMGGGGGAAGGGMFGSPAGPPRRAGAGGGMVSYDTGPMRMGRAAVAAEEAAQRMSDITIEENEPGRAPDLTDAGLAMLEDLIRDSLRARRSVYEDSKTLLLKMFKSVDDGSGDVSWEEFCQMCALLGVECAIPEAQKLFERFGFKDRLPYNRFAHVLLTQPSRQLAEEMPIRAGPFKDVGATNFHGKIKDKHCRKPLYTPTNWDPSVDGARSAELPNSRLVLQFVYGYNGKDSTAQNLFYNALGQMVYFVAGVGIVYTPPTGDPGSAAAGAGHSQHFFLGHTDDIKAMALCPAEVDVAGKKFPGRTIAATGQVSSHEEGPYICVWDTRVGSQQGEPELMRRDFKKEDRGFCAMAFSPDGVYLTAVATDNSHTVYIIDWRRNKIDGSGKGQMGDPPQVYGVEWNPHAGRHPNVQPAFLTFGKKHIKMWSREGGNWAPKQLSTGRLDMQNVHSAAWLPPRQEGGGECLVVAGMADGQIYVFRGTAAIKAIPGHAKGPQTIQPDGHVAYTGVRGMRLTEKRDPATGNVSRMLLTGGADSTVLRWDVTDGQLAEGRFAGPPLVVRSALPDRGHCIRSLDYDAARDTVLVGTNQCDVMEVADNYQKVLVYGHCDDVWTVAFHPRLPNRAVTASEKVVYVWNTEERSMERFTVVGFAARAVAFSSAPLEADKVTHHIAVGGAKGDIVILLESTLKPVHKCKDSREGVTDIKYSPDSRLMAAATADTWIDIYSVVKGYQRVQRCTGHSSTVRGIDWSADSSILQSDSADLELLVWNARTGKQIPIPSRDTQFATYTVRLGFPVMGIWPDGSDGTDVNALSRSTRGDLIVTCDDDGLVKLFNCPCVLDDAPHRAYRGHSSHVMSVRFSADDRTVLSVGGYDWGMFQFAVVDLEPAAPEPAAPQKVWGALDPEGRAYGWTYTPYDVKPAGAAAAGPSAAAPRASASGGIPSREPSTAAAGYPGAPGSGAGSRSASPLPPDASYGGGADFGGGGGAGGRLVGNAAPMRMHDPGASGAGDDFGDYPEDTAGLEVNDEEEF
ncbi:hypothetical protein HXX76_015839 [Chlamydomonas incerta]|uniref:EF-hand domain-containing protein n=1 Tax=Chlamydomonas incerta TaxID=51695 RepID=A0A835SLM5_CHLIN|nr:hypothetical protein HXX76_015839 [Chlamydomonas incerta]|eukprot:KAG2422675.1 hypothetical protein HXX76_015839 [Chlamydomonas incerta]